MIQMIGTDLITNRCQRLSAGGRPINGAAAVAGGNVCADQCHHRRHRRQQWHAAANGRWNRHWLPKLSHLFGRLRFRHSSPPAPTPLFLLLLFVISAIVGPSVGQVPPFPVPSVPLPINNNDASVAAIVDDAAQQHEQPVEVVPAELTVDGATDDDQSTTNALSIDATSGVDAKMNKAVVPPPSAAAARAAWTKRFEYASAGAAPAATHLATPSGTVPWMMAMASHPSMTAFADGTERRRKPPAITSGDDQQQQQQVPKQKHRMRTTEEGADDDESDTNEAGTARLVAMEDVDRDELLTAAATVAAEQYVSTAAATDHTESHINDDNLLTLSSASASVSSSTSASSPSADDNADDENAANAPPISVVDHHDPNLYSASSASSLAASSSISPPPFDTSLSSPSTQSNDGGSVELDDHSSPATVPQSPESPLSSSIITATAPTTSTAGDNVSLPDLLMSASRAAAAVAPTGDKVSPTRIAQQSRNAERDGDASAVTKNTHAVAELDLKSDRELSKLMRRTTMRMRDYPTEVPNTSTATTTPNPLVIAAQLAASQAPSLFPGALPGGPFALPPPLQHHQQQQFQSPPHTSASQSSHTQHQPQQQRRHSPPRAEQFEQLGCGWDLMTQSCKDLFRVGWCESCADLAASPFFHDCRCTAVTGLYVQTASFLGSSAAAARANAALTANQTAAAGTGGAVTAPTTGGVLPPVLPVLPLLPTLAQIGTPLEAALGGGGANVGTALPRAATAELQQQLLLANALRFAPQPVPTIVPMPPNIVVGGGGAAGGGGFGLVPLGGQTAQSAAVQQQQQLIRQQQQQQQQQQWDVMTPILMASPHHRHTDLTVNNVVPLFSPQLSASQFSLMKKMRKRRR